MSRKGARRVGEIRRGVELCVDHTDNNRRGERGKGVEKNRRRTNGQAGYRITIRPEEDPIDREGIIEGDLRVGQASGRENGREKVSEREPTYF